MSGIFPISPIPMDMVLDSTLPLITTISASGKRQTRETEGHLWKIDVKYDKMERSTIAPLYAFVAKQLGDSFTIVLPMHSQPLGTISGTPTVLSGISAGVTAFQSSGGSGSYNAGDIIKFANHSKVYMIADDAPTGGAVNFFPDLVEDVSGGTSVVIENVPFQVYAPDDVSRWRTNNPTISRYDVKLVEDIQ